MTYYIRIEKPREFRRDVLEASREVITSMQGYRKVIAVREKKIQVIQELQKELKEINLLCSKLDKMLPERQLREEATRRAKEEAKKKAAEQKAERSKKKTTKKKVEPAKPVSEIEALSSTLEDIEKKLANLK